MSSSTITSRWQPRLLRQALASRAAKRLRLPAAVVLCMLLLNALVYGFALAPATGRLQQHRLHAAELQRQHADALQFQKQKGALTGLREGMLAQKDVPLLLKDLVSLARRQNLSVGAINSDIPAPASGGLTMLAFTVPLTGSYGSIKRYIYEIETTDRLVGIQDLRFSTDKKTLKLDLKLITYIRGE